ncbi:MAG TPA: TetR/AcrR family transcriptional regulator [Terracidiphilus sp.]|nr:TetR/AcrR family transcriptional regulator [Terracidiphilus sp.]
MAVKAMGERRRRNPVETKERIFAAATRIFAERGFDGARVDQIAASARVNKQMLYHYFGSKDALFTAVLERAYRGIRGEEAALELTSLPADEAILRLVEFTWNHYLRNPYFIRLLNSENQMEARHLKASPATREINASHIAVMRKLLRRGRHEGTVRSDLDPMQLNVSIAALGFFYLMNRHTLSTVFERDLGSARMLNKRLAAMKDIIRCWIRPQRSVRKGAKNSA